MKNTIKFIPLLFAVIFSAGCEKEIPFDSGVTTSKLVLNSLFTSDSVWSVHVSRSISVVDTGNLESVFDANVKIFDAGGSEVATLNHVSEGIYASLSEMPIPNENYRIEISAPGYVPISAEDAIPGAVQIVGLDTNTSTDSEGNSILEMELTFQDPAGVANYYMIEMILSVAFFDGIDTLHWDFPARLNCTDRNIETDNSFDFGGFENTYEYILLRDDNLDGQSYTIEFSVVNWEKDKNLEVSASVSLVASSEAFFNYRRSFAAYEKANGNPFAQPVQVFSNVTGGLGIFAGGTRQVWEIDF